MGRLGVKQTQLAQVLGMSQGSISAKVNGKTPFDLDEIEHLAAFFRIPPSRLMGESTDGPLPPMGGDTRKSPRGKTHGVTAFRRKPRKSSVRVGTTSQVDSDDEAA